MNGTRPSLRTSGLSIRHGAALVAATLAVLGVVACDGDAVGQDTQDATGCEGARKDAAGKCRLPNGRFAKAACCAPPASSCHEDLAIAVDACIVDQQTSGEWNPDTTSVWDLAAACADIEPMAGVRDAICEDEGASFCALDLEAFAAEILPVCEREAVDRILDATCVFGTTYRDVFTSEAIVVIGERRLHDGDPLEPGQAEQIVEAVRQSSHEPATVEEAFAAVDQGEVVFTELWDASARRAFTAYEYGAGDSSYGAIFAQGTTTIAASIGDGDLYDCQSFWGAERRRCEADADCEGAARCVGSSSDAPLGRCIDASRDDHASIGEDCARADADFGCPAGSGLRCAGGSVADGDAAVGTCWPAWMTSSFGSEPELPIADDEEAGTEAQILAYGLATVDVEVRLDLLVSHPRPADLRITLVNPAGNEVPVFDGATDEAPNGEVHLDGARLGGFSGDESVNGVWRLRAVDGVSGSEGTLHRFALTVSSRWD